MCVKIYSSVLDTLLQCLRNGEFAYPHPDHATGIQQPDGFWYQRVLSESENLLAHEEAVLGAALKEVFIEFLTDFLGFRAISASS